MSLHSPHARAGLVSPFRPMGRVVRRTLDSSAQSPARARSHAATAPSIDDEALLDPSFGDVMLDQPAAFLSVAARTIHTSGRSVERIIEELVDFDTQESRALAHAMCVIDGGSRPEYFPVPTEPLWLSNMTQLVVTQAKRRRFDALGTMSYLLDVQLPKDALPNGAFLNCTLHALAGEGVLESVWMVDHDLAWAERIVEAAGRRSTGGYRSIKPITATRAIQRAVETTPDALGSPLASLADFVTRP